MSKKLHAVGHYVVIKVEQKEDNTGMLLGPQAERYIVESVGAFEDIQVGDEVLCNWYAGDDTMHEGQKYLTIPIKQIKAVIK